MAETEFLKDDAPGIARAAELLRAGATVAFPTETVYGLGADATNGAAVAAIYAAKGRPRFNPLIVHVADPEAAERLIVLDDALARLADRFWPGPLTLVAPIRAGADIAGLTRAGLPTLAVRVPAHPCARALLQAAERPLAAPSANASGRISPTRAAHVALSLNGRIAAILDGGACPVGLESTIIGLDQNRPVLLRPGGVATDEIETVLGCPLSARNDTEISAPGQLSSHYAPRATLRLNAAAPRSTEIYLGFGPAYPARHSLSPSGSLIDAAATLFDRLHDLDHLATHTGAAAIAIAPIPDTGLGLAINDRLRRAAAPR